ncbi:hypothetical protein [[Clostridium] aminophilum]|uniref:hypothetical protein n=1 Tax=[Clostridium] aminophilum TaxID=1526 RepID=UPI00331B1D14
MKKQMAVWITAGTLLTLATGVPALAETVRTETYNIYNGSGTLDGSVDTSDPVGVDVTAMESGADPENVNVNVTGDVKVQTSNTDYNNSASGVDVYSHVTDASVNVSIGQEDDDGIYTGGTVTVKSTGENGTANGVNIRNEGTGPVNVNTGKIDVTATGGSRTNGASVSSNGGENNLEVFDDISARNDNAYTTGLSIDDCGPTEMPEEGVAHSTVRVYGNIEASSKNKDATGVSLNSEHNDLPNIRSEAYIYGNVTADSTSGNATGVKQYIRDGASHIFIDDITAKTKTGETAVGVDLKANGGTENIYVNGGIHAEGGEATGVSATVAAGTSSNIIIEVTNGIFATGTEDSAGIRIENMIDAPILSSDSEITIVSDENVESSGTGIVDMNTINGVKTNLVVEGAVIAEAGPAVSVVTQSLSSLDLTVWKLESKTGSLVAEKTENGYVSTDTAKKVEQSIDYIIQVAPNASDYTDLTAARKTVGGYTYDVGKAGEKIAVTFHVPDGYTIDSAYSDESKTALQHVSGNEYLLVVPDGGGVMINLKLVPVSNNGGSEDDNYSGNPPAEYESHNFSRSGSHYSLALRKNQMEVVLSTAELRALLESGLTELTFMTSAGNFTFPSADLWTMVNNFATVRFAVEEGHMNAYGDNNAAAFKTVDPDVVENTVS